MADNITYRFIQNVGDYFPSGYFSEDFIAKVQNCAGRSADDMKALCSPYVNIRSEYEEYKNFIINGRARREDEIMHTHDWHTTLLRKLGYDTDNAYQEPCVVKDGGADSPTEIIPVRHILRSGDQISMLIMEMQNLITIGDTEPDGLFKQQYEDDRTSGQQRYYAGQWRQVIPAKFLDREKYRFSPAIINKAITQIFLLSEERRPHFILMLAGNTVFLFDRDKWARGSYLQFSLDDLYFQGQIKTYRLHYALFHLLCCKDTLAADGQTVLMDNLIEESYKNAYEVTKDLKEGVILAVESLANEALYYMKQVAERPFGKKKTDDEGNTYYDETDDDFEAEVKDDCLTIVYRLLFILFSESRPELDILPTGDEVYKRGYSFEALRDLEQVRLISDESRNGYFFDASIKHLFRVLSDGFHTDMALNDKSFQVRPIDSPMFNDNRLKQLKNVCIRNVKWQEIIKALSLSRSKKYCGRISYANLGVNQLGSVYESLLAYRGFYAEEDYIEVHKAGAPEDGTFLVPYSRMSAFNLNEVLCDPETGEPKRLPRGTFVYRPNARDRQKSASYYTPEVLTRSTIKYTIKAIVDEVREGKRKPAELLDLKILEPAVGAAAFLNEVINQISEAYMTYVEKKPSPDHYRDELQKVKAYIATHNVYGVDLNPTAIELGKLSLWLNVIHKDMETPFFANRLTVGNAVIGAWLKVYLRDEVIGKVNRNRMEPTAWWEKAPHKVKFFQNRVNRSVNEVYHFLLPDKGMLAALGISDMKTSHPDQAKWMQAKLKDWTAPVRDVDFRILQRISAKIDLLLRESFETQVNIERLTNNKKDIWPHEAQMNSLFRQQEQADNFAEKERIFDTRYRHDNAYYKLKLVMDYWCALWFWEYEDADKLPTRLEFWQEIENLLDVSDDKLDANTKQAVKASRSAHYSYEAPTLFDNIVCEDGPEYNAKRLTEEEAEIVEKSKAEILEGTKAKTTLFEELEPERFKIAKRLAKRYHFFHPMLEFIEVFWLRDGFDIICGNPPWVNVSFDIEAIISEAFPEVSIRGMKVPEITKNLNQYLSNNTTYKLFNSEQVVVACSTGFVSAKSNYPCVFNLRGDLYKCVLENCFCLVNNNGFIGLLHPDSVFADDKGQAIRKEMYHRLRYHFQYHNKKNLFVGPGSDLIFGENIYGSYQQEISFKSISYAFIPNTIDASLSHDGHGQCLGLKVDNQWNTSPHKCRIINYTIDSLKIIADTFENGCNPEEVCFVSIFEERILSVLSKISKLPKRVSSFNHLSYSGLNQTTDVANGTIDRCVGYPTIDNYEMVYVAPQISVANPLSQNPRANCRSKFDNDNIILSEINDSFIPRMVYSRKASLYDFKTKVKGFRIGVDMKGNAIYDNWIDHYKIAVREFINNTSDRSLSSAILPPKVSHLNTIVSIVFENDEIGIEFSSLLSSIVMDFFLKNIGAQHLNTTRLSRFPLGLDEKFKSSLFSRILMLNCINKTYQDLWNDNYMDSFKQEVWSKNDIRLKDFKSLSSKWDWNCPLRNAFERRMALIEIDVIISLAIGLSFNELQYIYDVQFPILKYNEEHTWYDANGNIVYSNNRNLNDIGVDGDIWDRIKNLAPGESFEYTINEKSELYFGHQFKYVAPFSKCDRVEDYKVAWAYFEKQFKKD